jgi:hypothetical protein
MRHLFGHKEAALGLLCAYGLVGAQFWPALVVGAIFAVAWVVAA